MEETGLPFKEPVIYSGGLSITQQMSQRRGEQTVTEQREGVAFGVVLGGWAGWLQIDFCTYMAHVFGEIQSDSGTGSHHRARR